MKPRGGDSKAAQDAFQRYEDHLDPEFFDSTLPKAMEKDPVLADKISSAGATLVSALLGGKPPAKHRALVKRSDSQQGHDDARQAQNDAASKIPSMQKAGTVLDEDAEELLRKVLANHERSAYRLEPHMVNVKDPLMRATTLGVLEERQTAASMVNMAMAMDSSYKPQRGSSFGGSPDLKVIHARRSLQVMDETGLAKHLAEAGVSQLPPFAKARKNMAKMGIGKSRDQLLKEAGILEKDSAAGAGDTAGGFIFIGREIHLHAMSH